MIVRRKLYSVMDEEGNMGYYLYDESTGEEKLFSVVEEEERMYFLGEHRGKFGKGGTASGVVFTGKDVLKEGADTRLLLGPKGAGGGKIIDYANLENHLKQNNAYNDTFKNLSRKRVGYDSANLAARNASKSVTDTPRRYKTVNKAIKKQKFNKSSLGKVLKKVKIR